MTLILLPLDRTLRRLRFGRYKLARRAHPQPRMRMVVVVVVEPSIDQREGLGLQPAHGRSAHGHASCPGHLPGEARPSPLTAQRAWHLVGRVSSIPEAGPRALPPRGRAAEPSRFPLKGSLGPHALARLGLLLSSGRALIGGQVAASHKGAAREGRGGQSVKHTNAISRQQTSPTVFGKRVGSHSPFAVCHSQFAISHFALTACG